MKSKGWMRVMVIYWFCVVNDQNWKVVRDKQIWGVTDRHKNVMERAKPDDLFVFYVTKRINITGIFKVVSRPFISTERIFSPAGFGKNEIFPHRVKLSTVTLAKEPVDFRKLIPELGFIRRKDAGWVGHILGTAMRPISKRDYEVIKSKLEK